MTLFSHGGLVKMFWRRERGAGGDVACFSQGEQLSTEAQRYFCFSTVTGDTQWPVSVMKVKTFPA